MDMNSTMGIAAVSVVALAVLGASVAAAGSPATTTPGGALKTVRIGGVTVLAYTYVGDSAPGQANGNGLNLNGGLWHEVTASG